MKSTIFFLFIFSLSLHVFSQNSKPIAINISSVHDYSTELAFTDAFKQCREWISFNADNSGPWETGIEVELNENGYPLQIPYDNGIDPPQKVRTLLLWDPEGYFRLRVKGTGTIRLRFGANGIFQTPIDTLIYANAGIAIEIDYSAANNPITGIQFALPAYTDNYLQQIFTTEFTEFLSDFQCIRYMDWLRTNFSPVVSWEERGMPNFYTQTTAAGAALEYVVMLSNLLQKDIWVCIPHKADDNYIQQLANMLHTTLDPSLKVYLEYSNEVWNGSFLQHQEAAAMAADLGYTGQEWERAWKFTAKRSADVFNIFENVFTDNNRLIRIIPSQAANAWLSNQIITYFKDPFYNPHGVQADALAIAPYFAGNVANDIVDEGLVNSITIAEILNRMEASLQQSFDWMQENQTVADNHNLRLVTYEGGQHLVGTGANINIDVLTEKLIAANHHPDLQDIYCAYLEHWYANHGDLFAHFSSHGQYSKWGSWGLKETFQDVMNPKYLALQNCVFEEVNAEISPTKSMNNTLSIYPNPSQIGYFKITAEEKIESWSMYTITAQPLPVKGRLIADTELEINIEKPGTYFLRVNNESRLIINL